MKAPDGYIYLGVDLPAAYRECRMHLVFEDKDDAIAWKKRRSRCRSLYLVPVFPNTVTTIDLIEQQQQAS